MDEVNGGMADEAPDGIAENEDSGGIAETGGDHKKDGRQDGGKKEDGGIAENADSKKNDGGRKGDSPLKEDGKAEQPADWELAAPEDFPVPAENLKSFSDAAKKLGLSKEQAEGMLAWHQSFHNDAMAANEAAMKQTVTAWQKEMAADAEFGGQNSKATLANARKALAAFDEDGKLRALLRNSGYQFQPDIVRVVARVGAAMAEHDFVGNSGGGRKMPLHERMYPEMGK